MRQRREKLLRWEERHWKASGRQPLKNRVNVVLTTDKNYKVKDTVIVHSVEEMVEELKKYNSEDVYVIGGESIYRQLLPYCTKAYVTKIDHAYDADTYFPIWMQIRSGK